MDKQARKYALNLGLYLGLALIIITTLSYVVDLSLLASWWVGLLILAVLFGFALYSCYSTRKIFDFPSFKNVFTSYTITVAVGLAISTTFTIILFNVIDPEAAEIIKEQSIAQAERMMKQFNTPQSEIDKALTAARNSESSFSLSSQIQGYFIYLTVMLVLGLLAALLFKKNNPYQA